MIQREDWGVAQRMLAEAQDRIGRLLREVGDKSREAMMGDRSPTGDAASSGCEYRGAIGHAAGPKSCIARNFLSDRVQR